MIEIGSLIISLIALIFSIFFSIYTYCKSNKYNKEIAKIQTTIATSLDVINKNTIIVSIIERYMDLHLSGRDKGIGALIKAGILQLREEEAKEIVLKIAAQTGKNPLGRNAERIFIVGIVKLLNIYVNTNNPNIDNILSDIEETK